MNAPEAGIVKEFLAKEEDTVTVGQELLKIETGGAAKGTEKAGGQTPKSPASEDKPTSSQPEPPKENDSLNQTEKSQPEKSRSEKPQHATPPAQTQKNPSSTDHDLHERKKVNNKESTSSESKISGVDSHPNNREERRVFTWSAELLLKLG